MQAQTGLGVGLGLGLVCDSGKRKCERSGLGLIEDAAWFFGNNASRYCPERLLNHYKKH